MWTITSESIQRLSKRVQGSVLTPDHAGYDQVRRGWNLSIDQHPAVIVVATNTVDVQAGVRFAHDHQLGVSIQSTGHGIVRAADDQMLIITSRMSRLIVDPETETAWVEAGVIWKQVLEAGKQFGLAPLLGSSPYVGVIGYTLGGGMGWLARKYGLAADSVIAIEIVTPDGELRHASAAENSDLFWALRGGGGNFGVVTSMQFHLYPVASIYGGELMYPVELAGEVLRFFRDWITHLPDEMTSSVTLMSFPPLAEIPEEIRGRKFVQVKVGYVGSLEQGEEYVREWLEWVTPIHNTMRLMPFTEVGTISNDPVNPLPGYLDSEMFNELTDEAIDVIVRYVTDPASPLVFTAIRHMGGAIARADRSANAIGNRDSLLVMEFLGATPTPEMARALAQYNARFRDELWAYISGGVYLNFMGHNDAHKRTKDAYSPENYERLMTIKAKYDPDNRFRYSFVVPVAKSAGETVGEAVHAW
jgi:hypothetical protein